LDVRSGKKKSPGPKAVRGASFARTGQRGHVKDSTLEGDYNHEPIKAECDAEGKRKTRKEEAVT